ncbi:glycosyltransferase [Lederbergia graminis]|uniref:Glycosyltransferase n=1 Tax=Lederbergia graminis TaxID=735518 RepID=A0ABW0LIA9_9BACI
MQRIGICGNFGFNQNIANGQIVKTKVIRDKLTAHFGNQHVYTIDSYLWKKRPLKILNECVRLAYKCDTIIILPAHKGIKVFAPLFNILCRIFNCKLQYSVIGGWLPEFLNNNRRLLKSVKNMDTVYVETKTMQSKLVNLGLDNVVYMPNFKDIKLVSYNDLPIKYEEPYKLCTFSRVIKEKGIIDAISAVNEVNKKLGRKAFVLDIYGTVDNKFENELQIALEKSNDNAKYMGLVEFDKSTEVLKKYFALLFPTYYEGEGFPGTIIDAYSSGLPVIASDWRYNKEIIKNDVTGFIYKLDPANKSKGLEEILMYIYSNPDSIITMKRTCIDEAKNYASSVVMQQMIKRINKEY